MYTESMINNQFPKDFIKLCNEFIIDIEIKIGEDIQITELTRTEIKNK